MQAETHDLGSQIRNYRIGLGMSQAVVSEQTGVSRRTLIRWESGKAQPRRVELDLVRSVLGMAGQSTDPSGSWRRALTLARGRLGFSYESMGLHLDMHASSIRRFEEGKVDISPDQAKERFRSLPLHSSEIEAFLVQIDTKSTCDWTNFDLCHDRDLESLDRTNDEWWQVASEYARQLGEAHRLREARKLAESVVEGDAFQKTPKAFQFSLRYVLARSYFFDSWRSAQRGLTHLRQLKTLAVGRVEICESEALMAECLSFHARSDQALMHIRRAVSIAEGLGGNFLSLRRTDLSAVLLQSGNAEAALKVLPGVDSDGAVEFVKRARLMSDIQSAKGEVQKSAHWQELAESVIEQEKLHGRFRLCPRTMPILADKT